VPTNRANASPTKEFFVTTLTRDISLDDCILDLVDNSIDGAWSVSGFHASDFEINEDLAPFTVDILIESDRFRILDNCGGISLDNAIDYAFTFGRLQNQPDSEYSVGIYGIGMKRAIFKIGNSITIDSTYEDHRNLRGFRVPIDVHRWLTSETTNWEFDIDDSPPSDEAGVVISVQQLSEETKNRFADPTYLPGLKRVLARDYMIPLMRGLNINLNGERIEGEKLLLAESDQFVPMRSTYGDAEVKVEIIAGMSFKPPDSNEPDDRLSPSETESGWYVICNGRVVLAADRSALTGWGVGSIPRWHPQYLGFVGVAFFSAQDSSTLPMTTTKRNVDVSSSVYRRALARMEEPTRAWIDYTNKRKENDHLKALEGVTSSQEVSYLASSPQIRLPAVVSGPAREVVANVNYSVPRARMLRLAEEFGGRTTPFREVGLKAFDYAFEHLVDEEEE